MTEFRDWEPADSYAPQGEPDPLQVARRIHEDRAALEYLAGRELASWPQLDQDEQKLAVDLAGGVIAALRREMTPQGPALYLHSFRYSFGHAEGWTKTSEVERQLALDMMDLIVNWMLIENSAPTPERRR